jgi:hypothetical protein
MPRELWNQGRVVGYSSYEMYVRQFLSENPDKEPASEREWLSSTVANGSSIILKVTTLGWEHVDDGWEKTIPLDANSRLCAANTIYGSFFMGESGEDRSQVYNVVNYGSLISNDSQSSPPDVTDQNSKIPSQAFLSNRDNLRDELKAYSSIIDGVVIQPGTWERTEKGHPYKDLKPNMSLPPVVKLLASNKPESSFTILLTGFTHRAVISGVTGLDGSTVPTSPEDGSFLGPAQFPWSAKIVFITPTVYTDLHTKTKYTRKIPRTTDAVTLQNLSIIDMKDDSLFSWYNENYSESRIDMSVGPYSSPDNRASVLTVHRKLNKYAPGLYGTNNTNSGNTFVNDYLNPIDTVAPGNVKMFQNWSEADMTEYESTYPGVLSMSRDDDGMVSTLDSDNKRVKFADVDVKEITVKHKPVFYELSDKSFVDIEAKALIVSTGKRKGLALSLSNSLSDTQYTVTSDIGKLGIPGVCGFTQYYEGANPKRYQPKCGNITVEALLLALSQDCSIDILGKEMKILKSGLSNQKYDDEGEPSEGPEDQGYIQMPNGLRLYISSVKPTGSIPFGSIGIGWTDA